MEFSFNQTYKVFRWPTPLSPHDESYYLFPVSLGQEAELAWVADHILRRYTRQRSPISALTGLDVE